MITEIIFDTETQRLFQEVEHNDPSKLGISIVSAYIRDVNENHKEIRGEMRSFWDNELDLLWPIMGTATRIIGFNSLKFDVPVLIPYAPDAFAKMPHFDIMAHVRNALGHSLSLSMLGQYTLGKDKSDIGTNAVIYWKQHDKESLFKLKKYCEADVLLTRDLYDYGMTNKKLIYMDRINMIRDFSVDFSYPKDIIDSSRQIGLF